MKKQILRKHIAKYNSKKGLEEIGKKKPTHILMSTNPKTSYITGKLSLNTVELIQKKQHELKKMYDLHSIERRYIVVFGRWKDCKFSPLGRDECKELYNHTGVVLGKKGKTQITLKTDRKIGDYHLNVVDLYNSTIQSLSNPKTSGVEPLLFIEYNHLLPKSYSIDVDDIDKCKEYFKRDIFGADNMLSRNKRLPHLIVQIDDCPIKTSKPFKKFGFDILKEGWIRLEETINYGEKVKLNYNEIIPDSMNKYDMDDVTTNDVSEIDRILTKQALKWVDDRVKPGLKHNQPKLIGNNLHFIFNGSPTQKCLIAGKVHNSNGCKMIYNKITRKAKYTCMSGDCEGECVYIPLIMPKIECSENFFKELVEPFELTKLIDLSNSDKSLDDNIDILKPYFCRYFAKLCHGGKVEYVFRDVGVNLQYLNPANLKALLTGVFQYTNGKRTNYISLYDVITKHIQLKVFNKTVFLPYCGAHDEHTECIMTKLPPKTLNVFEPCEVIIDKEIQTLDNNYWAKHLFEIVCNQDEASFQYVINWFGQKLFHPENKIGTGLVFQGGSRGGKGICVNVFGEKCLSRKGYMAVDSFDKILGDYTPPGLETNLMILMDEAIFSGSKKQAQRMKFLITEQQRTINVKFRPSFVVDNYSDVVICSNEDHCVHEEKDGARFLMVKIDDKWCGNDSTEKKAYFSKIGKTTAGQIARFLKDNMTEDWIPEEIPFTKMRREQILESLSNTEQFWEHMIMSDGLGYLSGLIVPKDKIYRKYEKFCKNSYAGATSRIHFWRKTIKIFGKTRRIRVRDKIKPNKFIDCVRILSQNTMLDKWRLYVKDLQWGENQLKIESKIIEF